MFMSDISISSVKMGLFVCWQITNLCVFTLSPPFFIFLLSVLASVVLLDTTSVLGELGWKTYPINGVRWTFSFLLFSFTVHFASIQNTGLNNASSVILILNRSPGCSDPFHPCFCSDPSAHMGNTVTRPQIMSQCLWGSFCFTLRFFSFGSRPVCDRGGRWHIWLISEC